MVVEWLRSCYSSEWLLFRNSSQRTKGYYFFAADDAPCAPVPTNLFSSNWTNDELGSRGDLGEVLNVRRPYRKGGLPFAPPPAILIGSADCITNGEVTPLPSVIRTLPAGIDSRCWTAAGLNPPGGQGGAVAIAGGIRDGRGAAVAIAGGVQLVPGRPGAALLLEGGIMAPVPIGGPVTVQGGVLQEAAVATTVQVQGGVVRGDGSGIDISGGISLDRLLGGTVKVKGGVLPREGSGAGVVIEGGITDIAGLGTTIAISGYVLVGYGGGLSLSGGAPGPPFRAASTLQILGGHSPIFRGPASTVQMSGGVTDGAPIGASVVIEGGLVELVGGATVVIEGGVNVLDLVNGGEVDIQGGVNGEELVAGGPDCADALPIAYYTAYRLDTSAGGDQWFVLRLDTNGTVTVLILFNSSDNGTVDVWQGSCDSLDSLGTFEPIGGHSVTTTAAPANLYFRFQPLAGDKLVFVIQN